MTHGVRMDVKEPKPTRTDMEPTWDIIIQEYDEGLWGWGRAMGDENKREIIRLMEERRDFGFRKHGVHLTPDNGRNDKNDSLQELADFMAYTRNMMRCNPDSTYISRQLSEIFNTSIQIFEKFVDLDMK